jgi:hypothetical protein
MNGIALVMAAAIVHLLSTIRNLGVLPSIFFLA